MHSQSAWKRGAAAGTPGASATASDPSSQGRIDLDSRGRRARDAHRTSNSTQGWAWRAYAHAARAACASAAAAAAGPATRRIGVAFVRF